jgi:hypothetical protein
MTNNLALFDEFERTNTCDKPSAQEMVDFINESAWPVSERVRTVFEQWFSNYPDDRKKNLRRRFREGAHHYDSAAFELMLHELLRRLGFAVVVEPELREGHGRPDFAITDQRGRASYIEATVGEYTGLRLGDPLQNDVFDAINEIRSPDGIALRADPRGALEQAPSHTRIQETVREWLEGIDPARIVEGAPVENRRLRVRCGKWRLKLTAIPCKPGNSHQLIQAGPMPFGTDIDDVSYLRNKLLTKARKYRNSDKPLIVALSIPGSPVGTNDQIATLFGERDECHSIGGAHTVVTGNARIPDSVWLDNDGPRSRGLHGVTFFRGWMQAVAGSHACTYINPFVEAKIPKELLQLGSARIEDGRVVYHEGPRLGEILGLPGDWPGPPGMLSD